MGWSCGARPFELPPNADPVCEPLAPFSRKISGSIANDGVLRFDPPGCVRGSWSERCPGEPAQPTPTIQLQPSIQVPPPKSVRTFRVYQDQDRDWRQRCKAGRFCRRLRRGRERQR
jgi:hypothetical protein